MHASKISHNQRSRELRRRVMLPARLRAGMQWSDVCILNISSRGLLIHSPRPTAKGATVELWLGEHLIVARVVSRDGPRVGLRSEDRVPVEQIISLGEADALQLTAGNASRRERRRRQRASQLHARLRGRTIEFTAVSAIGASLAIAAWSIAEQALARPLTAITVALGG